MSTYGDQPQQQGPVEVAAPPRQAPPTGPGVVPPFAAPPTDGIRRRMWIGLSAGAAALVLCCVGGVGGFIALGATAERARTNAATKVVTDFLTAWEHSDFPGAYQLLCEDTRDQVSLADFTSELSTRQLSSFSLDDPDLSTSVAIVPAQLRFSGGGIDDERYPVTVNNEGRSEVCPSA
jgi:hypothetical protein